MATLSKGHTHYGNFFRAGKPLFVCSKETLIKEKKVLGHLSFLFSLPPCNALKGAAG